MYCTKYKLSTNIEAKGVSRDGSGSTKIMRLRLDNRAERYVMGH
jgi:hypothetical protein